MERLQPATDPCDGTPHGAASPGPTAAGHRRITQNPGACISCGSLRQAGRQYQAGVDPAAYFAVQTAIRAPHHNPTDRSSAKPASTCDGDDATTTGRVSPAQQSGAGPRFAAAAALTLGGRAETGPLLIARHSLQAPDSFALTYGAKLKSGLVQRLKHPCIFERRGAELAESPR
jgi:hypothetical protein